MCIGTYNPYTGDQSEDERSLLEVTTVNSEFNVVVMNRHCLKVNINLIMVEVLGSAFLLEGTVLTIALTVNYTIRHTVRRAHIVQKDPKLE